MSFPYRGVPILGQIPRADGTNRGFLAYNPNVNGGTLYLSDGKSQLPVGGAGGGSPFIPTAIYHVDPVNGSDLNNGREWWSAFATFTPIASLAAPNVVVNVSPGAHTLPAPNVFDGIHNIRIKGQGGRSFFGTNFGTTRIDWPNTGATVPWSFRSNKGFMVEDCVLTYSNSGFTGHLVDLSNSAALSSGNGLFRNCEFRGLNGAVVGADMLVNADQLLSTSFENCMFANAQKAIQGKVNDASFSNSNTFYNCLFQGTQVAPVWNPGQNWNFINATVEAAIGGGNLFIGHDTGVNAEGLQLLGCSIQDGTAAGTSVAFQGKDLSIIGGLLTCAQGGTGVSFDGGPGGVISGVVILGVSFYSNGNLANGTNIAAGTATDFIILGNTYTGSFSHFNTAYQSMMPTNSIIEKWGPGGSTGITYLPFGKWQNPIAASGAFNIDASVGNEQLITVNGNITPTIINPTFYQDLTLHFVSTGAFTATWPANIKWAGGSAAAPVLSTTAGWRDIIRLGSYDGTNWYEQARAMGIR